MYIYPGSGISHVHKHFHTGAGSTPFDRGGRSDTASSSSGEARRRLFSFKRSVRLARPKLGVRALKPVTYSVMHLTVAICVAYALTRDWRIALGVGVIEPMVQTVAYMLHEKAWGDGGKSRSAPRDAGSGETPFENALTPPVRS